MLAVSVLGREDFSLVPTSSGGQALSFDSLPQTWLFDNTAIKSTFLCAPYRRQMCSGTVTFLSWPDLCGQKVPVCPGSFCCPAFQHPSSTWFHLDAFTSIVSPVPSVLIDKE